MEEKLIKGQQAYLPLPALECVRVPKVFDWIVKVTQIVDESVLPAECLPLPTLFDIQLRVTDVGCEEKPFTPREDVTVTLPTGTIVTLQRVVMRKFGTYEVTIRNLTGTGPIIHCIYTKDFVRFEKVLLCAPEGTSIVCEIVPGRTTITSLDDPENLRESGRLNVDIVICQSIQAEAVVKLLIEAEFCAPRPEIAIPEELCVVTFPPQCPVVFPGTSYPYPGTPIP